MWMHPYVCAYNTCNVCLHAPVSKYYMFPCGWVSVHLQLAETVLVPSASNQTQRTSVQENLNGRMMLQLPSG